MGAVGQLTWARLRHRPGRWLLLALGVALALLLPVVSAATGQLVAARTLSNAIDRPPRRRAHRDRVVRRHRGPLGAAARLGARAHRDHRAHVSPDRPPDALRRARRRRRRDLPARRHRRPRATGTAHQRSPPDVVHAAALRGGPHGHHHRSGARPGARARRRGHGRADRPAAAPRHVRPGPGRAPPPRRGSRCAATALVAPAVPARQRLGRAARPRADHLARRPGLRRPLPPGLRRPRRSRSARSSCPCPTTRCCARTRAPPPRRAGSPCSAAPPPSSCSASSSSPRSVCVASTARSPGCCAVAVRRPPACCGSPRSAPGSRSSLGALLGTATGWVAAFLAAGAQPLHPPAAALATASVVDALPSLLLLVVAAIALTTAVLVWPDGRERSAWHVVELLAAVSGRRGAARRRARRGRCRERGRRPAGDRAAGARSHRRGARSPRGCGYRSPRS